VAVNICTPASPFQCPQMQEKSSSLDDGARSADSLCGATYKLPQTMRLLYDSKLLVVSCGSLFDALGLAAIIFIFR
jgi:hypothetical protein